MKHQTRAPNPSRPSTAAHTQRPGAGVGEVALPPVGDAVATDEDLVRDILRRVQNMFDLPADQLATVERDVRQDWGGDRPYIAKLGESVQQVRSKRDERIYAEYRRGERTALLARRWGIGERRVQQIVQAAEAAASATAGAAANDQ